MVTREVDRLDANARDLFAAAMSWADSFWDEAMGLLWNAGDAKLAAPHHTIRGSVWYAFGLLMRNRPEDTVRAARVIDTLLRYQLDAPPRAFHGTFLRAPEEPAPPAEAVPWRDYDPNWRELIITVLALVLFEYAEQLSETLVRRIDVAIRRAVAGARARGLSAAYTNIALMHAFMLCFAGRRYDETAWYAEGERMAREVYRLFKPHGAFAEYNSPTYYGVDLYALALWRSYPALSALLVQLGREMEETLWRDIAQFYHAGLRNLAGPYDRSYGMDMRRYVSVLGIWMRLATDERHAPFPGTGQPFAHAHDLGFVPLLAFLGAQVPPEAREQLLAFRGERQIERVLSDAPRRVATAWLGPDRMIGGEFTSRTPPESNQFHPATIHWRMDAEQVGWVRAFYREPLDARASKNRLELATTSEIAFLVCAPGAQAGQIERNVWRLPQCIVRVETNAAEFQTRPRESLFEICYRVAPDQPIESTLTLQPE